MLSNQKMLFEKLGVGLHSDIDLQACEIVHKLPCMKDYNQILR